MDKNYSKDINDNLEFAEAYYENRDGSICTKPCLYVKYNNNLIKIKSLNRNNVDGAYDVSVSLEEIQKAGVNINRGDECTLVVKYYGKTYNHDTSENGNILTYTNNIKVTQGNKIVNSKVNVYVGYKKISGNLF